MRRSGVLLPISSMPSEYGIGCFSKECYEFVDFLERANQTLWQILPLGPTGYGDSPYQSFSTFAGNPYFIDLEDCIQRGWLTKKECDACDFGKNSNYVDYEKQYKKRFPLLRKAFERSKIQEEKVFWDFCEKNSFWLTDYCLFMALKNKHKGKSFVTWDEPLRSRDKKALETALQEEKAEVDFYRFQQFLFQEQWGKLKAYAGKKGIKIVGDLPIYVAYDSADTWAHPELFQLEKDGTPTAVAGCPPDAFSSTGQLWGNPLYRWAYHEETEFAWWMKRLEHGFALYDIVRIDHFRGFDSYYAIPYGDRTAEKGHWEEGPGYEFIRTLKKKLGNKPLIAEDLGYLTPSVRKLLKKSGYPGMKILLFAFDFREPSDYLPHNYDKNCVVYTGTHDNDTIVGWLSTAPKRDIAFAKKYLGVKRTGNLQKELIRTALASVSDTVVIPIQDYLGLGNEARMNQPSTLGGNWQWRMSKESLTEPLAEEMARQSALYVRNRRGGKR